MPSEIAQKAIKIIEEIDKLVDEYRKINDDARRAEILTKIFDLRAELEILLLQLTRL